jgi:hypothetical protein
MYHAKLSRSAGASQPRPGGRLQGLGLALVPLLVVVLLVALMFPRGAEPRDLPLPQIDSAQLAAVAARDAVALAQFDATGLGPETRELGSALRVLRGLPAASDDGAREVARSRVATALRDALAANGDDTIALLMRVQRRGFLRALAEFSASGIESTELRELGGSFMPTLRAAGWLTARSTVIPTSEELSVLYKIMWVSDAQVAPTGEFALSRDEQRLLFALFLRAPHAPDLVLREHRRLRETTVLTPDACHALDTKEQVEKQRWRLQKVRELAEIDPEYPRDFALGVAAYQAGNAALAASSFRRWLDVHPDGPLTLRAQNYLAYSLTSSPK